MAKRAPVNPQALDAALRFFRRRVAIGATELEALIETAAKRSRTTANRAQLALAQSVFDDINRALANGTPLDKLKTKLTRKLLRSWSGPSPHQIETIVRTETQRAFTAGRFRQLTHPATRNLRPFWIFDAVLDSVTSAICRNHDGTVRHIDDPYWQTNYPPLHFNCRSNVRALRRSDAKKRAGRGFPGQVNHDGTTGQLPTTRPDGGFGDAPSPEGFTDPTAPDLSKTDPELAIDFEAKERG